MFYSNLIKQDDEKTKIIKTKTQEDPVTLADLKVNELIIKRINEKYKNTNWEILSEENVKIEVDSCNTNADWIWILDPLDGTKDFIQSTGNYAMHLALNYRRRPCLGIVLIPEKNELWFAVGSKLWCEKRDGTILSSPIPTSKNLEQMTIVTSKNHRNEKLNELISKVNFKKITRMGSVGCKIASIIRGESDIYISLSLPSHSAPKDWDFAAPEAILKAAGGTITNLDNQELIYSKNSFEQRGIIVASNNKNEHEKICLQLKEIIRNNKILPLNS